MCRCDPSTSIKLCIIFHIPMVIGLLYMYSRPQNKYCHDCVSIMVHNNGNIMNNNIVKLYEKLKKCCSMIKGLSFNLFLVGFLLGPLQNCAAQ